MMTAESAGALFPWLDGPWRTLSAGLAAGRLPQALLIQGAAGLGKTRLAEVLAQRLLCRRPTEFACGRCSGCLLFLAGTHPDFIRMEPSEPGKPINVDSVRHLLASLSLKPQYGGYRVVVFEPAHQLNTSAANALLKTLEEPAAFTVMLLLTDSPSALPATILSRCQRLPVSIPDPAVAVRWLADQHIDKPAEVLLAAARGAPLRALALCKTDVIERRNAVFSECADLLLRREDPVLIAERWEASPHEDYLEWMLAWSVDLIRFRCAPGERSAYNPDLQDKLRTLAQRAEAVRLFEFWDLLLQAKRALAGQVNRRLLLEEVSIAWWRLGEGT
jgi:DNA polymerase-3 subunit delta'